MTSAIGVHHRGRAVECRENSQGEILVLIFQPARCGFTSAPCLSRPLSYSAHHTRVSCSR